MASVDLLFSPFEIHNLSLKNRIVMPSMTRGGAPNGIPTDKQVAYYSRRAAGGVGLILTEGVPPDHEWSFSSPEMPIFHGEGLAGWKRVCDAVHAEGGKIMPQIWHIGGVQYPTTPKHIPRTTPSGISPEGKLVGDPLTDEQLEDLKNSFVRACVDAKRLGFDGVEIHACHGYLLDLFFWNRTNKRADRWGGDFVQRTSFPARIARDARAQVGLDFPIFIRLSQWKQQDYKAKLAASPHELEQFLAPIVDAGVDVIDCSTRRFWEPEFEGSDLNLAGWVKKLTGLPTMTVGSVSLSTDVMSSFTGEDARITSIDALLDRLEQEEFDLVGVGRMLIADPDWPKKVLAGRLSELVPFSRESLANII
ncbi:MAG TPA: NADH:flavin oxidoreductase [Alphaproteobacteria bacterium]|nr:NADH:flavin oxidoreductase [Alphaproteobacteria bacterium]